LIIRTANFLYDKQLTYKQEKRNITFFKEHPDDIGGSIKYGEVIPDRTGGRKIRMRISGFDSVNGALEHLAHEYIHKIKGYRDFTDSFVNEYGRFLVAMYAMKAGWFS